MAEAKAEHDRAHAAYLAHLDTCETTTAGRWCLDCYELCGAADGAGMHLSNLRSNARRQPAIAAARQVAV